MSNLMLLDDFSAGWCPADDPVGGRKNALLKMDALELEQNGEIRMAGGTKRMLSAFTNDLIAMQSVIINTTEFIYSCDNTGLIFRDNTQIATGGSTTRAAINAAFSYAFIFSGNKRVRDDGFGAIVDLGVIKPSAAPTLATGAAGVLTGDYEYAQVNLFVNGNYSAKSARGPIGTLTLSAQQATVTPQNPSVPSSNATEAWIFRRGVNLDTWYRIARVTSYGSFSDNMSDADALALGITLNDFLLSINSTDIPNAILACVGLIYRRFVYFTAAQVLISDINSPDSLDSRTIIGYSTAGAGEVFKWAIKTSKNTILVGTTKDVYCLSGTFIQLPDGFLDVSLDPLGVDNPPVGTEATLLGSSVIYMSKSGWVACSINGNTVSLVIPNLDRYFNGDRGNGYGTFLPVIDGTVRYSCVVTKNKFYGIIREDFRTLGTTNTAIQVYDFIRKYWRVQYHGIGLAPLFLSTLLDGTVIGYDATDKFIKKYNYRYDSGVAQTLDDGSNTNQAITFRTIFQDHGKPRNRKDLYTLTIRGKTGSNSVGVTPKITFDGIPDDEVGFTTLSPDFKGLGYTETSWDISGGTTDPGRLAKSIQVDLSGSPPDLHITDISISYDDRPLGLLHLNIQDLGITGSSFTGISTLNFVLDTRGQNVDFYPVVDGTIQTKSTFNTSKKSIVSHYFTTLITGRILTGYFVATTVTPFEYYGALSAGVVLSIPEFRKFNHAGPIEVFRYGKLKKLEIRVTPSGGTTVTYSIYEDSVKVIDSATLTVVDARDAVYEIGLPKTTSGTVLRIEFSTTFVMALWSARVLAAKSGKNSDEEWISVSVSSQDITV